MSKVKTWNVFKAARYENGKLIESVDRQFESNFWHCVDAIDYDELWHELQNAVNLLEEYRVALEQGPNNYPLRDLLDRTDNLIARLEEER